MKKKLTALLLTAAILTGCGAAPAEDKAEQPENTTPPTLQVLPAEKLTYRVELEPFERSESDEDGQMLALYQVQVPVMEVYLEDGTLLTEPRTGAEEEALAAAETFNQKFEIWTADSSFQELSESARMELEYRKENGFLPMECYAMELSCSVYQTEHLVSVAGLVYSFTGGVHPNTRQLGWNFDLESGMFLDGEMMTADSFGFRSAVADAIVEQARKLAADNGMKPEEMYWPEYETTVQDWGSYTVFFDETGMTVAFSPYELAPYAAGSQEFHFSYDWLGPLLSERGRTLLGIPDTAAEN